MIEEQFSKGDSFVHGLDPRVRLMVAVLFSAVVAVSSNFLALLSALTVSVITAAMSKPSLKKVFYRLALANGLILFLWLILPFTYGGEPLFRV